MEFIGQKEYMVRGIRIHSAKKEVIGQINNRVILKRDPNNCIDSNAIEVFMKDDLQKIGYIAREEAANLAPILDEYSASMTILTHTCRLVQVCDSMTAVVRVKFYYCQDDQKYINLCGNTYDDLKDVLGL